MDDIHGKLEYKEVLPFLLEPKKVLPPEKGMMRVNVQFTMDIPVEYDSVGRRISPTRTVAKYIDPFCAVTGVKRNFPLDAMKEEGKKFEMWADYERRKKPSTTMRHFPEVKIADLISK